VRKIRERSEEKEDENWKKEKREERRNYGNADEEEERERDEEMRGRAADSGISRKVSAISRRRVLGTDRFLERTATKELRIDGVKSLWILLQITLRIRNEKTRWNVDGSKFLSFRR